MIGDLKRWLEHEFKPKDAPKVRGVELSERELDMLVNALSALRISEAKAAQRRFEYTEIVGLRRKLHGELLLRRGEEGTDGS